MTFAEFKEQVNALYKAEFPNSACDVSRGALGRETFFITFYLAGTQTEFPNGIAQNDLFNISFHILQNVGRYEDGLPIEDDKELPDTLILDAFNKSILTKSDNKYMAYSSISLPFRKTTGTPEKILETLKRYIAKVKSTLVDLYHNDQVPEDRKEFVASKLGLTENVKTEDVEYISKDELDKMPDDYKTTVGATIDAEVLKGNDRDKVTKLYKKLGYVETDPMILARDDKLGTVLKPVKVKENKNYNIAEGKVTTPSGTYEFEELNAIEEKMKQAFKDFWHNKITGEELQTIKKDLGLSEGEIRSCQYIASREEDVMKESKEVKVENIDDVEPRYTVYDYGCADTFDPDDEDDSRFTIYDNVADAFYYDDLGYSPVFDTEEEAEKYIQNNKLNESANQETFYKIVTGIDEGSIQQDGDIVTGTGSIYYYKTEDDYENNNEDAVEDFKFKYNKSNNKAEFSDTDYVSDIDDDEFIWNLNNNVLLTESIQSVANVMTKIKQIEKDIKDTNGNLNYNFYEKTSEIEEDMARLPDDEVTIVLDAYYDLNNLYSNYDKQGDIIKHNGYIAEVDEINTEAPDENIVFIYKDSKAYNEGDYIEQVSLKSDDIEKYVKEYIDETFGKKEEAKNPKWTDEYIKQDLLQQKPQEELDNELWDKFTKWFRSVKGYNDWSDDEISLSLNDDDIADFTKYINSEKEVKTEAILDTTPEKFTAHCDECLEDFEYTFDPLNEVSNDIEIYQKGKDYAYYAECPNCGNLIEVGPEELDLVITNIDDVSINGFYMEIMDKHTARKTWLKVSLRNGGWQYEFNQQKFDFGNDNDVITSMFIQELEDYEDDIWELIDEAIADSRMNECATQASAVDGGKVSLFREKAKQLREKKSGKVSTLDDLDIILGLEGDELVLQDMEDWNRVKEVAKSLAGSQGFYGRLLADMEEMEPDIGDESFPIIL